MINITINGKKVQVEEGITLLEAAKQAGFNIPTLCYNDDLEATGGCGLCVTKVKMGPGYRTMRACTTKVAEGMEAITQDAELMRTRKTVLELILSNHPQDCLSCERNHNCELQQLASDFGIREIPFANIVNEIPQTLDCSSKSIKIDTTKCIQCGRCVQVCQKVQKINALASISRGISTEMKAGGEVELGDSPCINCGQCAAHCPVGAIVEKEAIDYVWDALLDSRKYCIVQCAPAVRVGIGEEFGLPIGTNSTGKMLSALRALGFKGIFDTNFGADLTIMEEGSELVDRVTNNGVLPLLTSCCPAWVNYVEKFAQDMIPHLSSAKSPHQMVGPVAKTYYAQKMGIDPKDIVVVSVMPCTAKKQEIDRDSNMSSSGHQDVDYVLTTRELGKMIKQAGIEFAKLEDGKGDDMMADYTGAATIFGATGGVMEAALRTGAYLITKKDLEKVEFYDVRGLKGVKEATVKIGELELKAAVVNGIGNVPPVIEMIREAKANGKPLPYHFVEVMACPGGCVTGGGQPYGGNDKVRVARAKGLYDEDSALQKRCSHHNESIKKLYKDFLGEPLHGKSHELLHTTYQKRNKYNK